MWQKKWKARGEAEGTKMDGKRLGKAIIGGPVTEIRALLDRESNCVVHVLWEGDILQRARFWKGCLLL